MKTLSKAMGGPNLALDCRPCKTGLTCRISRTRIVTKLQAAASLTEVKQRQTYVSQEARAQLFSSSAEQVEEVQAKVSGRIPDWIDGSLVVNGGGDYKGMVHMFDGYAMLSKVRISRGAVHASQRFIQSLAYSHFAKKGGMRFREFATPVPAETALQRAAAVMENTLALMLKLPAFTDNASVNVVPLPGGKVLAMSESGPSAYEMDVSTLATLEQRLQKDGIPGDLTTAHPKALPDGTLVNFTRSLPFGGYHVYKMDPQTLKRTQIAFIKDRNPLAPGWVHDIAVTPNHLVIIEPPIFFNMPSLMLGSETDHIFMDWKPEQGTQVHVVPLDGKGEVKTFSAPTFFFFHTANAYEEDGQIHVDFSVYDDAKILNDLRLDALRAYPGEDVSRCWLRRLSIPLGADPAQTTLEAPQPLIRDESSYGHFFEFPSVNPQRRGQKARYVYANAAVRPTNMGNGLGKFDVEQGTATVWHEEGALPGEPAFVPAPSARSEDDGVVLSIVMGAEGRSFLLALDGITFKELGRAQLPFAVPYRFHGTFLNAAAAAM
mmetsp:Transcript_40285/g.89470  ORF Transcript_40285/g.89470 Transcript_40285/m.89470 type:complete len:546 (-) Transcript_40285:771-2408(-)